MTTARRIDNLLLLPAACVAEYATWQARANRLPPDTVLIVLPVAPGRQREALAGAARLLVAKGRRVTIEELPELPELPTPVAPTPPQQPVWTPALEPAVQLALEYGTS